MVLDFLQHELDPIMRRATEIGNPALKSFRVLLELRDSVLKSISVQADVKPLVEELKEGLQPQFNIFLAQTWRKDRPIMADEIAPALLCESTDTIGTAVEILQKNTPEAVGMLYERSVTLLKEAAGQGFQLPAAGEKLELLKACFEQIKSTTTANA
jgi:hypothetical protein